MVTRHVPSVKAFGVPVRRQRTHCAGSRAVPPKASTAFDGPRDHQTNSATLVFQAQSSVSHGIDTKLRSPRSLEAPF
jgi:hypothetical protein